MVGSGWVTPSEFWRMHPTEIWWLVDAKRPRSPGHVSGIEADEILEQLRDAGYEV